MRTKTSIKSVAIALIAFGLAAAPGLAPIGFASGGPGGGKGGGGGGSLPSVANVWHGPRESLVENTIFTVTFHKDGRFSSTSVDSTTGVITSEDAGTWTLTAPVSPQPIGNPQAHLRIVDSAGIVLLEGDVFVLKADQIVFPVAADAITPISP